ncbi:MAG: 50S ribosomal protein L30 [Thermoplasmata archaeon]|nr:50S ribosomal protein L30 [Thermoplasmata archaeon]
MSFVVVRVRGTLNIKPDIKLTMKLLRLNRTNHCVVIPETAEYTGMLKKVKDYVTWGEVSNESMAEMIQARGKLIGDEPITDKYIKANSDFKDIKEFASAVTTGSVNYNSLKDVKPIFRLSPPNKGGYEGIKRSFQVGGALGYRGEKINVLIKRML